MVDIDKALSVFQNKARRDILERLVREPHYPLQIADQIGISQQAVMKHLNFLEKQGFVVKMRVASNKGGPLRISILYRNLFPYASIWAQICSNVLSAHFQQVGL